MLFAILVLFVTSSCHVIAMDTLYDFSEPISQFTINNFTDHVMGSPVPWAVEFYASWCGHCQRFAPIFTELARDIESWHNVLKVGALACSDPVNAPLCRYYNIWGYPTLKIFEPHSTHRDKGILYRGRKSVDAIKSTLVQYLSQLYDLGPKRDIRDLMVLAKRDTRYIFLLRVDASNKNQTSVAREVLLDSTEYYPKIVMGWMKGSDIQNNDEVPSLYLVQKDHTLDRLNVESFTRASLSDVIRSYVTKATTPAPQLTTPTTTLSETQLPIPSGVYMQDIESGLYYSLWVEVAAHKSMDDETQAALLGHLNLHYKYIPHSDNVMLFLNKTIEWLLDQKARISGTEWIQFIDSIQDSDSFVPKKLDWIGCKGTQPKFRGYPCSVWMTYHTLTVAAYLNGVEDPQFNPKDVLTTMSSYVKHFLGCRHCANHFAQMAKTIEAQVNQTEDAVLWLWKSHNKVNNRLHGDPTEDPKNPKVQFPMDAACPDCRMDNSSSRQVFDNETQWNVTEIMEYLIQFYDPENIIHRNSSTSSSSGNVNGVADGGDDDGEEEEEFVVQHNMKWMNEEEEESDERSNDEDDNGDENEESDNDDDDESPPDEK